VAAGAALRRRARRYKGYRAGADMFKLDPEAGWVDNANRVTQAPRPPAARRPPPARGPPAGGQISEECGVRDAACPISTG
jgi:hypothetical protein